MKNEPKTDQKSDWKTVGKNLLLYVPSGGYYARVRSGGKLIRKSLETDIRSIAVLRLADLEKSLRGMVQRQTEVSKGRMTFGDALAIYEQRKESDATTKPNTKRYYKNLVKALLKSWSGVKDIDIRKLTKHNCLEWSGKFAAKASGTAYNNTVDIVKHVCEIAIEFGARMDNPARDLQRVTIIPKRLVLPTSEQFHKFVEAVGKVNGEYRNRYSQPCAFLVQFLAFGGFRKNEAEHILWQDVDLETGTINVLVTKNGQPRTVPIIADMAKLLAEIKAFNTRLGRDVKPTDTVMEVKECEKSMTRACKEVGMKRITHHDLRHLFASICIESGVDIPTMSKWLGHLDGGALAMRVYGHLRQEHSLNMAKRVSFSKTEPTNVVPLPETKIA